MRSKSGPRERLREGEGEREPEREREREGDPDPDPDLSEVGEVERPLSGVWFVGDSLSFSKGDEVLSFQSEFPESSESSE